MGEKERKYILIALAAVVVVLLVVLTFSVFGSSTIELTVSHKDAVALIDEDGEKTAEENQQFSFDVKTGEHFVIVTKNGYWPWIKEVTMNRGETKKFHSFNVPTQSSGSIITRNDPDYDSIIEDIENSALPTPDTPLASANGDISIFIEEGAIVAKWTGPGNTLPYYFCLVDGCKDELVVSAPTDTIRNVSFFRDRSDVIIYSTQNGIFAAELNKDGEQNVQSIYKGTSPEFVSSGASSLYVLDGETLLEIVY